MGLRLGVGAGWDRRRDGDDGGGIDGNGIGWDGGGDEMDGSGGSDAGTARP